MPYYLGNCTSKCELSVRKQTLQKVVTQSLHGSIVSLIPQDQEKVSRHYNPDSTGVIWMTIFMTVIESDAAKVLSCLERLG